LWRNVEKNYERYKYYFKFEPLDSLQLGEGMVDVGVATAKAISKQLNIPIEEVKAAILAEHADWAEPVVPASAWVVTVYFAVKAVEQKGAVDAIIVNCPGCFRQLDLGQVMAKRKFNKTLNTPVVFYSQLLGLALGIPPKDLGLDAVHKIKTSNRDKEDNDISVQAFSCQITGFCRNVSFIIDNQGIFLK
jgi:hypothetical protein